MAAQLQLVYGEIPCEPVPLRILHLLERLDADQGGS
jgi:hypothetical protein